MFFVSFETSAQSRVHFSSNSLIAKDMILASLLISLIGISNCDRVAEQQINALIDFYESTNGDYWYESWNITELKYGTVCDQTGITCNILKSKIYHLTSISNNLSGILPTSIQYLEDLTLIELYDSPNLIGTLPKSICNLTNLLYVELIQIGINGTIPSCIDKWNHLKYLVLESLPFLDGMLI